jgi:hypothetical protein
MNLILKVLPLVFVTSIAFGFESVRIWELREENTIAWAPNPKLNLTLNKIAVDNQYYGQLSVSLNYEPEDLRLQIDAVVAQFPNRKYQKIVQEPSGALSLQIPTLNISKSVQPKAGQSGPYVEDVLYLTKDQYKTLKHQIERGEAVVSFSGRIGAHVPVLKVIERKELQPRICDDLLSRGNNVGQLMQAIARMSHEMGKNTVFRYDSTREALVKDVRENCFELSERRNFESFKELSGLQIRSRPITGPLKGETLKRVIERRELELKYDQSTKLVD